MLLYEHPLSSYTQKVKIALREKGVPFTVQTPEDLGSGRRGTFAAMNPRMEVPVLIDGDAHIFESSVIMEYIEERWPDPPLLPSEPSRRAFARITEDVCDTHYEAINWGVGELLWFKRATGTPADRLRAEALHQTRTLQAWLVERLAGELWFGGDRFGRADAAAAPMVNRSVYYGMGPPSGTPLANWHRRVSERPSVAAIFAEFDAAAARMKDMTRAYVGGARRREYRDHRLEWMIKSGGIDVVLAGMRDGNIRFSWPDPS
jgi:RNA polymerase-associated protein